MAKKTTPSSKPKPGFWARMRTNFLTGLAVVLPIALTIYAVWAFIGFVDKRVLPFVPDGYIPQEIIEIRGVGLIIFMVFTVIIGAMTKGIFGRQLVRYINSLLDRVPVVRSIYNGLRQIMDTVLSGSSNNFEKACLVEYPRKGIWAVGFVSTDTRGEVAGHIGTPAVSVFLPTTPNPTSGFLLFFPREDVVFLDMEVEEAAKLIISAGLVVPPTEAELKAGTAKRTADGTPPAKPRAKRKKTPAA